MAGKLYQALGELVAGGDFNRFAMRTDKDWRSLAKLFIAKAGYCGTDQGDLTQEMLTSVWTNLSKVDTAKGDPARWLLWHARNDAFRFLYLSKGLVRTPNGYRGLPLSPLGDRVIVDNLDTVKAGDVDSKRYTEAVTAAQRDDATPEVIAQKTEQVQHFLQHATPRDRVLVMTALSEGSLKAASRALRSDPVVRNELGLKIDDKWNGQVIRRAVIRTQKRATAQETVWQQ